MLAFLLQAHSDLDADGPLQESPTGQDSCQSTSGHPCDSDKHRALLKHVEAYLTLRWDDRRGRTGMTAVIPQGSWADSGPTLGQLWTDSGPTLGRLWADFGSTLVRLRVDFGADFGSAFGRL